jgi:hypothetical protein
VLPPPQPGEARPNVRLVTLALWAGRASARALLLRNAMPRQATTKSAIGWRYSPAVGSRRS